MNKQITVQVVDDESLSRDYVVSLVNQDVRFAIVNQSCDGKQALDCYLRLLPDAVFLDLQMPDFNGFEFCNSIDTTQTSIVFVTAHAERALTAYDFEPVDFITKPIRTDRFEQTLDRVAKSVAIRYSLKQISPESKTVDVDEQRCVINTVKGELFYKPAEIQFLESKGNYVQIWIQNQAHLVRGTLQQFCENLNLPNIVSVHRRYAVNMDHVRKITSNSSGGAKLKLVDCPHAIPVSRSRRAKVKEILQSSSQRNQT